MIHREELKSVPKTPGVYIFYSNSMPLYIGKSKNLYKRIYSHLRDVGGKSEKFVKEADRLELIKTAGDFGAQIREARMVKKMSPVYNRMLRRSRGLISVSFRTNKKGYFVPQIMEKNCENLDDFGTLGGTYVFDSIRVCKALLDYLVYDHGMCPYVLGVEKGRCFMRMLGKCKGACDGDHAAYEYNSLLSEYFDKYLMRFWPYKTSKTIEEKADKMYEKFEIKDWRILSAKSRNVDSKLDKSEFTSFDEYKIIRSHIS